MLIGGVVDDKIENDVDVAFFGFGGEAIKIAEGAVHGVNGFVVGDVVAEVDLRGWEAGSDPDGGYAEVVEIVEFGGDAIEVADAVVIAVGKAAGIDFVENGLLPPRASWGGGFLRGAGVLLGVGFRSGQAKTKCEDGGESNFFAGHANLFRTAR